VSEPELIGTAEAGRLLGVSRTYVLQLVKKYHVLEAPVSTPRLVLLRRADVERLAREGWPGRRPKPST
jgi:excisionase family DNA binding protein